MRSVPLPFLSKITLLWTRAREPGPVSPVKVDSPLPFPWTQRGEIYSWGFAGILGQTGYLSRVIQKTGGNLCHSFATKCHKKRLFQSFSVLISLLKNMKKPRYQAERLNTAVS